ncbi:MAG: class II aldolase/adducin family protein [Candidatus Krumholzibacteriota bacterium]|nr:class II aldolase/adducin family protein [Candidatus Krumholzibacteriota bacterium]
MSSGKKEEIAYFMNRLYARGLTTALGGNISLRNGANSILVTPSGLDKGRVTAASICEVSNDGRNLSGDLTPSMETSLHLKIYKRRDDIKAVIHAHPPWATILSASNIEIKTNLTGESRFILGQIANVPYALMGSEKLAGEVFEAAANRDVIMIKNHGPVCLGQTLQDAFSKIEALEAAARTTLFTELLGGASRLTREQISEIDRLREQKRS